jgi:ABC-type branched-subunit amino acid transport system ATPase component
LRAIREAMRRDPGKLLGQEPSTGLSPEARERLKQALRQQKQ